MGHGPAQAPQGPRGWWAWGMSGGEERSWSYRQAADFILGEERRKDIHGLSSP